MNKKIYLRIFIIILILLWMNIVFGFSAQNSEESSGLSLKIASWLTNDVEMQHILEPYIRKIAHFSEYGLGGGLFLSFFSTFQISTKKRIIFACLLGIFYASTDEIHQLFVDGRSGKIMDVYIDSLGVITGALVMQLIFMIVKKIKCKVDKTQ